jgi:hypothetical protein
MSLNVQVFGRRHDESMGALKRPATEKRQGTKSRWGMCGGAASTMGIWSRLVGPSADRLRVAKSTLEKKIVKRHNIFFRTTHFLEVEGYDPRT